MSGTVLNRNYPKISVNYYWIIQNSGKIHVPIVDRKVALFTLCMLLWVKLFQKIAARQAYRVAVRRVKLVERLNMYIYKNG